MKILQQRLAAVLLALAVVLGAFGAHALRGTLEEAGTLETWRTAVLYHFIHALGILAAGLLPGYRPWKGWLLVAGIACFSGSLYLLALGVPPRSLWGPVTPLGGLLWIVAWAALACGRPAAD